MDIQRIRAKVREIRESLKDEWPWLMSVANIEKGTTAGTITQGDKDTAARCICDGTHRLATEEEVKAHLDREAAARKEAEDKANATKLFVEGVGGLFRQPEAQPESKQTKKG